MNFLSITKKLLFLSLILIMGVVAVFALHTQVVQAQNPPAPPTAPPGQPAAGTSVPLGGLCRITDTCAQGTCQIYIGASKSCRPVTDADNGTCETAASCAAIPTSAANANDPASIVDIGSVTILKFLDWIVITFNTFLSGWVLTNIGVALSALFQINLMNVGSMPSVLIGWTVFRDIANSLFILLVLWIAFCIIFNLEQRWGGKRLLVRVLIVALLINFSLAMVTASFGIANEIAFIFQNNLPKGQDLGGYIISSMRIQTLFDQPSPTVAATALANAKLPWYCNTTTAGKLFDGLINRTSCGSSSISEAAAKQLLGLPSLTQAQTQQLTGELFKNITLGIATSVLLLIPILSMAYALCALLSRFIAMILLAITAPAALFFSVVPGSYFDGMWKKWTHNLINYALFAPIFYFLLYLALYFLGQYAALVQTVSLTREPTAVVGLLISGALLVGSLKVAKTSGGMVADMAMKFGKTALAIGAGIATGGASLAVTGVGFMNRKGLESNARDEKFVAGAKERAAQPPTFMRRITGGARYDRKVLETVDTQRKEVEKEKALYAAMSPDTIKATMNTTRKGKNYGKTRLAQQLALADKGFLPAGMAEEAAQSASKYGMAGQIHELRPDLIEPDATNRDGKNTYNEYMRKLKPSDIAKWDTNNMQEASLQKFATHVLENGSNQHVQEFLKNYHDKMDQEKRNAMDTFISDKTSSDEYWKKLDATSPNLALQRLRFLKTNQGQALTQIRTPDDVEDMIKAREAAMKARPTPSGGTPSSGGAPTNPAAGWDRGSGPGRTP